jgi:Protein of unknown function (DUF2852)
MREQAMPRAIAVNILPWLAWIGLMAAGFALFWPLGLAVLIYLVWSGKMMCCGPMARWKDDLRTALGVGRGDYGSSGNTAFDAYRDATLKRLEGEQRAFADFLGRLRSAKDREEFERFMAERAAHQPE